MPLSLPHIAPLPENVRAQISSALAITSQEQVIIGLVENALDARAQSIGIELDLAKGYFSVQDDGVGIKEAEFYDSAYLAKAHCTSKVDSLRSTYGQNGCFLFNLSCLALLSITSRHESEAYTSRLVLHRGQVVLRQTQLSNNETSRTQAGTTIEVHNLFGDMPVRSRHLHGRFSSNSEVHKVFETLRRILTGYLFARSGRFDLRCSLKGRGQHIVHRRSNRISGCDQFTVDMISSILSQTNLMSSADFGLWKLASIRTTKLFIRAAISVQPAPSRVAQFISLGDIPVPGTDHENWLFKLVNDLFEGSTFGQSCELPTEGVAVVGAIARKQAGICISKSVDRWPMFYIRIEGVSAEDSRNLWHKPFSAGIKADAESLTQALKSLVSHFLIAHGFDHTSKKVHIKPSKGTRTSAWSDGGPHDSAPEHLLPKPVTTTGHLSQWHRVKKGRHSQPEDVRYGLPFMGAADQSEKQGNLADEMQLLYENMSSDEIVFDAPYPTELDVTAESSRPQLSCVEKAQEPPATSTILWTNPRNGQIVRVHPRTGATLPVQHSPLKSIEQNEPRSASSAVQHRAAVHRVQSSGSMKIVRPNAGRDFTLEPYLQGRSYHQSELPIPIIATSSPCTIDGTSIHFNSGVGALRGLNQITKGSLSQAQVLGQVDRKFVIATVPADGKETLVLVDQHAADERVRLEQLCQDFYRDGPLSLAQPLVFEIETDETALFEQWQAYFQKWHFNYTMRRYPECQPSSPQYQSGRHQQNSISIEALPGLIAERCRAEPKLLIDLLRQEIWSERCSGKAAETLAMPTHSASSSRQQRSWLWIASHCPSGVLEMLKSRSCRTAIMFNDVLDQAQYRDLVRRLAQCDFPFQCAHGRPSLTVLTELDLWDSTDGEGPIVDSYVPANGQKATTSGFRAAWDAWKS